MSDLVERLRGIYRIRITDGLGAVGSGDEPHNPNEFVQTFEVPPIHREAAAEIERLTAERDAALAKLAQYEQAPVVGWVPDDTATVVATRGYAMFSIYKDEPPSVIGEYVQLIARPEASHDST